jgi:DNA-binding NarL/FixJ family response regulator
MRILLVDAHPMVHDMLGTVVRTVFADSTLLAAHDLEEAFEHARGPQGVDLVLLDLSLPGCAGIEALARFRKAFPQVRVVVVSSAADRNCVLRALEAGALGYVPKTHTAPLIAAALHVVSKGGTYVPPEALKPAAEPQASSTAGSLTARQLDVIRLIVKGLRNKEIAKRLKIAEDTVKHHAYRAYFALGISSRTQVLGAAARRGISLD